MFKAINGHPFPRLEVSDYKSPKLKLVEKQFFSFYVAQQEILPGEILLLEKAIVFSNEKTFGEALKDC